MAQEKYVIVLMEAKEGFIDMDLSGYTDIVINQNASTLSDATISDTIETTVDGQNALLTELEGGMDGINIHYWFYTVENDAYFAQVIGWTLKSKTETNAADIKGVIESFHFTESNASETSDTAVSTE